MYDRIQVIRQHSQRAQTFMVSLKISCGNYGDNWRLNIAAYTAFLICNIIIPACLQWNIVSFKETGKYYQLYVLNFINSEIWVPSMTLKYRPTYHGQPVKFHFSPISLMQPQADMQLKVLSLIQLVILFMGIHPCQESLWCMYGNKTLTCILFMIPQASYKS